MRYLDKYLTREKELRKLAREMDRLRCAQRNAPIIPLERPYQRGWVKSFVLEPRVERRPDAHIFRTMLKAINKRVHCHNRSFVTKGGPVRLRPRILHMREWQALAWPASHQCFFRFGTWRIEDPPFWLPPRRAWDCGYKLLYDWWLCEDVQPHLITHQRVELAEVRERMDEIEAHMRCTRGWDRLNRLRGVSQWWRFGVPRRSDLSAAEQFTHDLNFARDQT